jgi:hypothetical protein
VGFVVLFDLAGSMNCSKSQPTNRVKSKRATRTALEGIGFSGPKNFADGPVFSMC